MFDNTIKLNSDDDVVTTAIIDGPSNQRTLRAAADGSLNISIAHTESNENPGFTNQRSVVRLEEKIPLDDTDKTLKAYVQLVCSFPKDHTSSATLENLISKLIGFLALAENSAGTISPVIPGGLLAVPRIYAGEP